MTPSDDPPTALRAHDQWVCWDYRCRDCYATLGSDVPECPECGGDTSKLPLAPFDGETLAADTSDPETWGSFDTARAYHDRPDTDTEGVGFVLSDTDRLAGADLDGCRDPLTGALEPWARDVVDTLDSYTEVSPSGTGLRVFVIGSLPDGGNRAGQPRTLDALRDVDKNPEIELYDSGRYLTFTGDRLDGSPNRVCARSDALDAVHGEYVASDVESTDKRDSTANQTPDADVTLGDRELIEKARNAANGRKFSRLYDDGDTGDYGSHSEARMALLNMLAFWTGRDKSQMDRLYRDSALYPHPEKPGKWDRLADVELRKAVRHCSDTYTGSQGGTPTGRTDGGTVALTRLPEATDPQEAMKDVRGTDTFSERWGRVTFSAWNGRDTFIHLLHGEYREAGYVTPDGRPDRSAGELALARYVGFWFDRDDRIARHVFEDRADVEKYHEHAEHRRDMYAAVRGVEWTYTDAVSLDARLSVANALHRRGTASKATLVEAVPYSARTVRRALRYFRDDDAVELDRRGQAGAYWVDRRLGEFIDAYDGDGVPIVDSPSAREIVAD